MITHFSLLLLISFTSLSLHLQLQGASPVAAAAATPVTTSMNTDTQNLINFKNALPNPALLQDWFPNQNSCSFIGIKYQEINRVSSIDVLIMSTITTST